VTGRARRAKRQSNWKYVVEENKSWDDWGNDLAASNCLDTKGPESLLTGFNDVFIG
jgi:hypothetical protein